MTARLIQIPVPAARSSASPEAAPLMPGGPTIGMVSEATHGVRGELGYQQGLLSFRIYQEPVFFDHTTKTMIIHWSRQIGKSHTLAAWAVDRLLRYPGRLVTVLSNSRDNGAEFVIKAEEVCRKLGEAIELVETESNAEELNARTDLSEDLKYAAMRFEIKITVGGKVGRIKVLAANSRTARGFSGDLILDEFAFHENSAAIWEAAEPIISANPDFLCRISSTGNGKRNMFYQLISQGDIPYYRVRRSDAWATGELKIYSIVSGKEITPAEARAQATDKRAYDQNYECAFNDENSILLPQELINVAQRVEFPVDEQEWTSVSLARMYRAQGELYLGWDFARVGDLSVIIVLERVGALKRMIGMLVMQDMRVKAQGANFNAVARLPKFRGGAIDMTGNGLGAFEDAEDFAGTSRVEGVNFSSTEPTSTRIRQEGRKAPTAKVTEIMASDLVADFEDRTIEIISDAALRDDLRKPEKIVSPAGRVSIAAARDAEGHADRFWSLALANRAARNAAAPFDFEALSQEDAVAGRDGSERESFGRAML